MIDYIKDILQYSPDSPMIFTKFEFWIFFAIVLFFYSFIYKSKHRTSRALYLLVVSLFFYYKSSGLFFFILLFSTFTDYYIGKWVYKSQTKKARQLLISLSVFINLSVLAYFKYAYFFTDSFNQMFHTDYEVINYLAHWSNTFSGSHFRVDKILLPVGISFYTFQTISYSIDIYRKQLKPVKNIIDFGFYVSFFPQLVAGPIVRASHFIPQMYEDYKLSRTEFGLAVFWILNGLVKKMFIGDYLANNLIDRVFIDPSRFSGIENILAVFGYSLQVYVDFSGYTDIAIGVALLLGFRLPKNFNSPYKALNVGDFWKRWHISLSSWLKDYLYIPMGGNRGGSLFSYISLTVISVFIILLSGIWWLSLVFIFVAIIFFFLSKQFEAFKKAVNTNINLMLTMLIGGLWHGASWQFVLWGGLNGIGLVVYKFWKKYKYSEWIFFSIINLTLLILWLINFNSDKVIIVLFFILNSFWLLSFISMLLKEKLSVNNFFIRFISIVLTFSFISFTRVFFRSQSMDAANSILNQVVNNLQLNLIPDIIVSYHKVLLIMLIGFVFHWLPETLKVNYRQWFAGLPHWLQVIIVGLVVFIIYQSMSADSQPFIYFQF